MSVRPFDPAAATAAELAQYAEVAIAALAADRPGDPALTRESVIAQLNAMPSPLMRASYWAARDGDRIVGTALQLLMDDENAAVAVVDVTVHPGFRRRGRGAALLTEVAAAAARAGRTAVMSQAVAEGSAGQAWADAHGFAVVQRTAAQTPWCCPGTAGTARDWR
jgi:mycothiol synthase